MAEKGKLIVISGPSGAGKSSVVFRAIEGRRDMCFSTSATTRAPRPGEQDGREYFFVTRERFLEMVEQNELLEHAEYVNNFYGTPRAYVEQQMDAGMNVVLDIEVQGARQVREKMPEAILIFVIPPDLEELRRRLVNRGTDSLEVIEGRLTRARQEYAEADFYNYLIVNDDLSQAAAEFSAILAAEHCRFADRRHLLENV
jgi:guanylate kinase